MKPSSKTSLGSNTHSTQHAAHGTQHSAASSISGLRVAGSWLLIAGCWLLVSAGLTGCEALQRKFTRKPKHPAERLTPIVQFQNYSTAMTPLDRYRKHYLLFDYWNTQLIQTLNKSSPSPKRLRHTSAETLSALETLGRLLNGDAAGRFEPLLAERTRLDQRLQRGGAPLGARSQIQRTLEVQTRQIHREFFWRAIEDQLKSQ